jgi:RHS repeat-associated protein
VYDGNGLRVEKCVPNCTSPTTTTVYIYSVHQVIAAYDNGAAVGSPSREYILASGTRIAKIASGATVYYHRDQVSTRVTTDANGNVLSQQAHYPFDENWYQSGATPNSPPPSPLTTDQQFTMYLRDTESGNDAAPAREFINRLGRFSVVDPMGGNSSNPQSLNRYAYATNDPIDLLDPEGEYLCITWCGGYSPVRGWGEFGMLDYFSGWPNFPTDTGPYNNLATVSNYLLGGLPIGASSSGGRGPGGGGLAEIIPVIKLLCDEIPKGSVASGGGSIGGIGGQTGSLSVVTNYDSGQISGFATVGLQAGWNGVATATGSIGLIYGNLTSSNSTFAGKFKTLSGSGAEGPGAFVSWSASGVYVVGVSANATAVPLPVNGEFSWTNSFGPLQMGNLVLGGGTALDDALFALRQGLCDS